MTGPGRYLVRTFGCQMNEHDSERIAGLLEADGYERATGVDDADVVVLNTCCIRENADDKLYGHLGHLKAAKQRRPDLRILVGGCLAQKDGEALRRRAPHVDVVFGTHNLHRAAELLAASATSGPITEVVDAPAPDDEDRVFASVLPVRRELPHAAWVTIQVGCDNTCAFCIVPAVRGPEVSRPLPDVVAEIRALAGQGVSEVTLLGQNVNSYGRDLTLAARRDPSDPAAQAACGEAWGVSDRRARPLFADLLVAAGGVPGIRRVRFTSPHPKDLRPETIAAMAEVPAVCEHLHLPLQSGSDAVLAAMHRGYTAERYLQRVAEARAGVADLALTTDIIVGFPGETEDDFAATLDVAATVGYDSAYTFVFSPRPGTEAAALTDRFVPEAVVRERYERLRVVVERSALARHRARIGRDEEVVIEGPSKKDPGRLTGRTRQNKLVHVPVPADPAAAAACGPGAVAIVTVTGAAAHHLAGELREVLAAVPARRAIPVRAG